MTSRLRGERAGPRGLRPCLISLLSLASCALPRRLLQVDPAVTWAAHPEHEVVVIDRARGRSSGEIAPEGWDPRSGASTFVLWLEGNPVARLSRLGGGTIAVSESRAGAAPRTGVVEPAWEDGALRLTLHPTGGQALRIGPLVKTDGPATTLRRTTETVVDLCGTYRSDVREVASGMPVGWIQVRVHSPWAGPPITYEAVLPPTLDDGLAAATVLALGTEVDWIADHALDVYAGD